ncbi:hypothetical protein [Spirochaeta isovalerica]|uniref:Uncharacterized protein n=1 Tax=Spirochaeta isovalerica TaxID=150 RepID=A0A841RC10_9SPIO|nr:hypothetical protein [Spirochaeta isovalerica]MBB6480911.1 hypothetical protein [Spirochaeta isovalerica]
MVSGVNLNALQVFCSDLKIDNHTGLDSDDRDFSKELKEAVGIYDALNNIQLRKIDSGKVIASLIDAGSLAMRESYDYLLYGTLTLRQDWHEVRLSLYERESDSVIAVIYSKSDAGLSSLLMDEAGRKLVGYLYDRFAIEKRRIKDKSPGYIELSINPGYRGIFFEPWNEIMMGYFHFGMSGFVALSEPRFCFNGHEMYPRFGLSLDYGLAGNQSTVENFFSHSFMISIPLDLSLDLNAHHSLRLGVAPGYQIDYLVQSRKYGDEYTSTSGAFVLSAFFTYGYNPVAGNLSIGLINALDFAFYDDLLISYKPSISISYKVVHFKEKNDEK